MIDKDRGTLVVVTKLILGKSVMEVELVINMNTSKKQSTVECKAKLTEQP